MSAILTMLSVGTQATLSIIKDKFGTSADIYLDGKFSQTVNAAGSSEDTTVANVCDQITAGFPSLAPTQHNLTVLHQPDNSYHYFWVSSLSYV